MLLAQLPTTTVKPVATVVWPGWAGLPKACLFVLVSIASWLSSHLLPMQSYLYQVPAAWLSFAVITHILNALQPQALYTRCPCRKSFPAGEGKLRFRGQGQLLCPSAWLISRLHLDWEPRAGKTCTAWSMPKEVKTAESWRVTWRLQSWGLESASQPVTCCIKAPRRSGLCLEVTNVPTPRPASWALQCRDQCAPPSITDCHQCHILAVTHQLLFFNQCNFITASISLGDTG